MLLALPFVLASALIVFFLTTKKTTQVVNSCSTQNFSGIFEEGLEFAYFQGQKLKSPNEELIIEKSLAYRNVLASASSSEERWIEVDLSEQKLIAREGDEVFLETSVSSGLPHTPTPTGEFRIWTKLRYTKMEGGSGKYYYYLPNVPYTMFFEGSGIPSYKGYGLHGTYWHNDFGTPRSHGCVNLPTKIAEKLFYWTGPVLAEKKSVVRSDSSNPGTRIVIHE